MKTIIIVCMLCLSSASQTVPVVALSPNDTAKLQRVHQEMLDAEKRWADLQTEITERYLIVDKSDPDASEERWYPAERGYSVTSMAGVTSWHYLVSDGASVHTDECSPEYKKERDRIRAEQEKESDEREAKSRRYRKGWARTSQCSGCGVRDFDYSTDWKYLVPKPDAPKQQSPYMFTPAIGAVN